MIITKKKSKNKMDNLKQWEKIRKLEGEKYLKSEKKKENKR